MHVHDLFAITLWYLHSFVAPKLYDLAERVSKEEMRRTRSMESIASSIFSNTANEETTVVLALHYQKYVQN